MHTEGGEDIGETDLAGCDGASSTDLGIRCPLTLEPVCGGPGGPTCTQKGERALDTYR